MTTDRDDLVSRMSVAVLSVNEGACFTLRINADIASLILYHSLRFDKEEYHESKSNLLLTAKSLREVASVFRESFVASGWQLLVNALRAEADHKLKRAYDLPCVIYPAVGFITLGAFATDQQRQLLVRVKTDMEMWVCSRQKAMRDHARGLRAVANAVEGEANGVLPKGRFYVAFEGLDIPVSWLHINQAM